MSSVHDFATALRKELRKELNDRADDIASGACTSFENYKNLCGVIQGLALAESYLLDLAKKVDTDDDQDA